MVYFTIALLLFAASHLAEPSLAARKRLYYFVSIALFAFVAFRYEVGCDWEGYAVQYDKAYLLGLTESLKDSEPGWWAMIYALSASDIYFPWINVITAAIFFFGVHSLAKRQPNPAFFVALLFPVLIINMPMSGIRQGAAIGIMCYAATCLMAGRWKRYVFMVAAAASLHNSALVFVILAPLGIKRLTPTARIVTMGLLSVPAVSLVVLGAAGQQAIDRYVDTGYDANGAVYRLAMLAVSGIFFFVLLRRQWREEYPDDYPLALYGSGALIGLVFILPLSSVIADRLGYYLIPIQAMIFARTAHLEGLRPGRVLAPAISLGFLAFLYVWTSTSNNFEICYVPYQNWLYEEPVHSRALR
jgi:hypothetical protein